MAARSRHHATYDDLVKVPEHLVAELVDGELYTSPRPGGLHARFASALGMDVGSAYDRGPDLEFRERREGVAPRRERGLDQRIRHQELASARRGSSVFR